MAGVSPVPSARSDRIGSDRIRIRIGRHEARSSADCRWPFCSKSLTGRCRRGQPRLRQVRREFRRSCALTALGGRVTHLRHGSTSDQQVELVLLPEELVGEPLPDLSGANSRHVAYNAQPTPGATQSGTPYRNAVPWPSAGVTWPELVGMIASATFCAHLALPASAALRRMWRSTSPALPAFHSPTTSPPAPVRSGHVTVSPDEGALWGAEVRGQRSVARVRSEPAQKALPPAPFITTTWSSLSVCHCL